MRTNNLGQNQAQPLATMETAQITRADVAEGFAVAAETGDLDSVRVLLRDTLPLARQCEAPLVCEAIVALERLEHLARRLSVELQVPEDQLR